MNNNSFEQLEPGIWRLKVPFENVWTSVYLLQNKSGALLLDAATTDEDVTSRILPALAALQVTPDMLLCSHLHGDHVGGMDALVRAFPNAVACLADPQKQYAGATRRLQDGEVLLGQFTVLHLQGHTADSIGVLDTATNTLLSCDSLQQLGLDIYPTSVPYKDAYAATLEKVARLGPRRIIFSHDYDTFGWSVTGDEEIAACLALCRQAAGL